MQNVHDLLDMNYHYANTKYKERSSFGYFFRLYPNQAKEYGGYAKKKVWRRRREMGEIQRKWGGKETEKLTVRQGLISKILE